MNELSEICGEDQFISAPEPQSRHATPRVAHDTSAEMLHRFGVAKDSENYSSVPPLFDPSPRLSAEMLYSEPEPERWLVENWLPENVVGVLAGPGGTGKSTLSMQIGIRIATGRPFMGMPTGDPGTAIILNAEDSQNRLHLRYRNMVDQMRAEGDIEAGDLTLLAEHFQPRALGTQRKALTEGSDGRVKQTPIVDQAISAIRQTPGPVKLVVLDPASRFNGGNENANEDATVFIEAAERIREATGATVLIVHHAAKGHAKPGEGSASVDSIRGASALTDGARYAAMLRTLDPDRARHYGLHAEQAGQFARLDVVKNNYGEPWPGMWVKRLPGGLLAPASLKYRTAGKANEQAKAQRQYKKVSPAIESVVSAAEQSGKPLSRHSLLRKHARLTGKLGAGKTVVENVLQDMIDAGKIEEINAESGRGRRLRVSPSVSSASPGHPVA